jgi:hypothetical protein
MGEEMEGAMQQAPQPTRHSIGATSWENSYWLLVLQRDFDIKFNFTCTDD